MTDSSLPSDLPLAAQLSRFLDSDLSAGECGALLSRRAVDHDARDKLTVMQLVRDAVAGVRALDELPHARVAPRRIDMDLDNGLRRCLQPHGNGMEAEQDLGAHGHHCRRAQGLTDWPARGCPRTTVRSRGLRAMLRRASSRPLPTRPTRRVPCRRRT